MLSITPFLIMFSIVIASVVTSCTTQSSFYNESIEEPSTMNVPLLDESKIYTVKVFSRINKIILFNFEDKSQKEELGINDWEYNYNTAELVIIGDIPFQKSVVHIEGFIEKPTKLILTDANKNFEPFIAINGRLAVQGYDYFWDSENLILTMRSDFSDNDLYYIYYLLGDGSSASLGNWHYYDDTVNKDKLSYQFSQHIEKQVNIHGNLSEFYYVLDENYLKGSTPAVVKKVYDKNKREVLNNSLGINKPRFSTSDKDLSKEVGYNVALPQKIKSHDIEYSQTYIFEELLDGKKYLTTNRTIQIDSKNNMLVIFNELNSTVYQDIKDTFTIKNNIIDLGQEVNKIIYWDLSYDNEVPKATKYICYRWEDKFAKIEIKVLESNEDFTEDIISEIIKFRMEL